jgi:hypothetical protein
MHPVGSHLAQAHGHRLRHRAQPAELITMSIGFPAPSWLVPGRPFQEATSQ